MDIVDNSPDTKWDDPETDGRLKMHDVIERMIRKQKLNGTVLALITEVWNAPRPILKALTRKEMQAACYHLRIDITAVKEEHDRIIEGGGITSGEAQRLAVAAELTKVPEQDYMPILALGDPRFLFLVAEKGVEDMKRHEENLKDYPGTSEWLKKIGLEQQEPIKPIMSQKTETMVIP
jgi:hypothetical protein